MHHRSRKDFVTFVLILGSLTALGPLAIDMYLPAFADIARDLGTVTAKVQLSLSVFLVGMAAGQLLYGSISDRYGRKRPLYAGLIVAILCAAACAVSASVEQLIAFRFFAALGTCAGVVISRAMIRDLFDPAEASQVFSRLILVMGLAPIIAPLLGGYVTEYAGWRTIFWILTVFGVLSLLAVIVKLPETRPPNPDVRLTQTLSIYGRILRDRAFMQYAVPGSVAFAGFFAYVTAAPFVFIELFGIAPDHFGWVFGANALGFVAMSQINARLVRRYAPERLLRLGLMLVTMFGSLLIVAGLLDLRLWAVWPLLLCYIATLGLTGPNSMSCALASQPASLAGSASALAGTLQFAFSSLASALLGLLHPHGVLPMTAIVGACGISALVIFLLLNRIGRRGNNAPFTSP